MGKKRETQVDRIIRQEIDEPRRKAEEARNGGNK